PAHHHRRPGGDGLVRRAGGGGDPRHSRRRRAAGADRRRGRGNPEQAGGQVMGDDKPQSSYASPPCMAGEVAPDYFDPLAVDPQQAVDVARWRKAKRAELLAMRAALPVTELQAIARGIAAGLDRVLEELLPDVRGRVISGFWPIKSEPDLRFWLAALAERGAITALPVVETRFAPL